MHRQVELRAQRGAHAQRLRRAAACIPTPTCTALILDAACKIARGDGGLISALLMRDGVEMSRIVYGVGDDARAGGHRAADDGALSARVAGAAHALRRRGRAGARSRQRDRPGRASDRARRSFILDHDATERASARAALREVEASRASTPTPRSRRFSCSSNMAAQALDPRAATGGGARRARAHRRHPRAPAHRRRGHRSPGPRSSTSTPPGATSRSAWAPRTSTGAPRSRASTSPIATGG